ncbi:MAG: PqqD family protein [Ruminococcus sp.]|nr:PqqD family protein [Ruminococcus sp.]
MKVKKDFILRKVSDSYIVVPVGEAVVDFSGMVNLNESGAFLFEKLQKGVTEDELVEALLSEYDVEETVARADVKRFISKVKDAGILE